MKYTAVSVTVVGTFVAWRQCSPLSSDSKMSPYSPTATSREPARVTPNSNASVTSFDFTASALGAGAVIE